MPKYKCRGCGTESYGCVLYTLRECKSCGTLIHREEVQEDWDRAVKPASATPTSFTGMNEKTERVRLLQLVRFAHLEN